MNDDLKTDCDVGMSMVAVLNRAKSGEANAQYQLGKAYFYGEGLRQNRSLAKDWWNKAAAQGQLLGLYQLGAAHFWGDEVRINPRKAVRYWEETAYYGDALCYRQLGSSYSRGEGAVMDVNKAIDSYLHAYALGCEEALDGMMMICPSDTSIDDTETVWLSMMANYAMDVDANVLLLLAHYCQNRVRVYQSKTVIPTDGDMETALLNIHSTFAWYPKRDNAFNPDDYDNLDEHDENEDCDDDQDQESELEDEALNTWESEEDTEKDSPMAWLNERENAFNEDDYDNLDEHDENEDDDSPLTDVDLRNSSTDVHEEIDNSARLSPYGEYAAGLYKQKAACLLQTALDLHVPGVELLLQRQNEL